MPNDKRSDRIRHLRRQTIPELRKLLRLAEAEEKYLKLEAELEGVDVDAEINRIELERRNDGEER